MTSLSVAPINLARSNWRVPYYVRGLALGIPVYLVAIHLWTWILYVPSGLANGGYDFRQFYAAGFMVRTGHADRIYDYKIEKDFQDRVVSPEPLGMPFVSPAYHALFFACLSFFKFRTAYFAFLAVNLFALAIGLVLLRSWLLNLRVIYEWLPIAIFIGFLPVAAALVEGQDSVLLLTVAIATFVLLIWNHDFVAGTVVALALFKFQIILPVMLLLAIWRRWRFCLGFSASAVVLCCISVLVTGMEQTKIYVESILSIAGLTHAGIGLAQYPINWQMMANVHGFIFGISGGHIPKMLDLTITIVLSVCAYAWTAVRGLGVRDTAKLFLLALPCSVLVGHHTYIHDLSVLSLPLIVLLNAYLPAEDGGSERERFIGRSAALMFVVPVLESFAPWHFYLVAPVVLLLLVATSTAVSMPDFLRGSARS